MLTEAFRALRRLGYTARQNFSCCSTCAWYELQQEGKADKAIFYNRQSTFTYRREGDAYLQWSGDGDEICRVLREHRLTVQWGGTEDHAIHVQEPSKH